MDLSYTLHKSSVAVVGVAFRFPGDLCHEDQLWDALKNRQDMVTRVPQDRWAVDEFEHGKRKEPGRSVTFSAGVLSRIGEFDAGFFGISPREAAWLDPQQRLLLELAWEAFENAGCPPSRMAGSDCAVYVGISGLDYGTRALDDLASVGPHMMTGNTLSIAANRLSYVFDLHGPSLAVDTACSSSLVALHHACNALRTGEASAAIVGGVNMLLHPYPFVGFSKASMLSADGRCKVFDEAGDGYVRSEGGAVLLLKPLERAVEDGDTIHAVILASGVNADGARKTGITIPSADGQSQLMREVLARSGLSPHDIDFVEAHGTGTAVGDPVEANAIGHIYGAGRSQLLPIGSVKANLGHLESASGMAGMVKAILALKKRALPPALHLHTPNPGIDFDALGLQLVREYTPLVKPPDLPLIAGVNSFGFGGANAHVIIQSYPSGRPTSTAEGVPQQFPLILSARNDAALRESAAAFVDLLSGQGSVNRYDLGWSAAFGRDRLEKRLAVFNLADQHADVALSRFAGGESSADVIVEEVLPSAGGVAFVYAGNGAQWLGMGRALIAESEQFKQCMEHLDEAIAPHAGFSVLAELFAEAEDSRLFDTGVAQPLLFAIQVALTELLAELGVRPDATMGHSVGEVAAAWAAGALDLAQAIRVITARSQAQSLTRGRGRMAAVSLSADTAREAIATLSLDGEIELAGVNSPADVTLSGALEALEVVREHLKTRNVAVRILDLDYAFHSRQMDDVQQVLADKLAGFQPQGSGAACFVSSVTGGELGAHALDADYWWRNVREPVEFSAAMGSLIARGCRVFLEIGPHAILQRYMTACIRAADVTGRVLPTLKRGDDALRRVTDAAMRVHLLATHSSSLEVFFPVQGKRVRLPNYPWQRERHWLPRTSECLSVIERRRVHLLLGWRLPDAELAWENTLDPVVLPWLADHKVGGAVVYPGAGYVEMALAAARQWRGGEHLVVEQLDIVSPMVFDGEHARTLRLTVNPRDGSFQISSRQRLSEDSFGVHAVGRLLESSGRVAKSSLTGRPGQGHCISHDQHYALATKLGLDYGPAFQGLVEAHVDDQFLEAVFAWPAGLEPSECILHPAVLDTCFQSLVCFFAGQIEAGRGVALLPVRIARVEVCANAVVSQFRARFQATSPRAVKADFELFDEAGQLVARASGCRFRAAPLKRQGSGQGVSIWSVVPRLRPHPADGASSPLADVCEPLEVLHRALAALGPQREGWFKQTLPLIEALALSFAYEACQVLQRRDPKGWHLHIASAYGRWLAGLLESQGLLVAGEAWELAADTGLPPADALWQTLLRDTPACLPKLTLLGRVGRQLPGLLTGEVASGQFLQALRRAAVGESLYSDDLAYLGTRVALQDLLRDLSRAWPRSRRLRVLEITAGLTDLPTVLADSLPEDRFGYVVATPDEVLLTRQQAEYQDKPGIVSVAYDLVDGSMKLEDQASPNRFDVVLIRHVLHRTLNTAAALENAHAVLAPGGLMVVAERHPDWSANLVGGLDPQWWQEADAHDRSPSSVKPPLSALSTPEAWRQTLQLSGFDDCDVLREPAADSLSEGAYLVTARRSAQSDDALPQSAAASWSLLVDRASAVAGNRLAEGMSLVGQTVEQVDSGTPDSTFSADNIVVMLGWGDTPETASSTLGRVLDIANTSMQGPTRQKLWLITRGGALTDALPAAYPVNPAQSALWGFARVLMNEMPAFDCTLIDLDDTDSDEAISRLQRELLWPDGVNEILVAGDARFSLAMQQEQERHAQIARSADDRFRLDFLVPGQLRNLMWLPDPQRALKDHEIEVSNRATGLNFRDVMFLMGLLPDEAVENGFAGASLGLEFAGVVTRAGVAVSDLKVGDAVMGFGATCFASHVVTRADAVARIPEGWGFEAAATVPTVFFTVYYALKHLADLQPGERVLIHGAAGGVGIAAVQLARHLGAEVFATAGSDDKRDFVALLGADHVYDSRSLSFADDVLAATAGEGVDIVLNSLAGEAMRRSLDVLKPFGRFLELGKRDFFENTAVGLRPFRNNITYFGIDADQLLIARPALAARLFSDVMALFREDVLAPLPYRCFTVDRVIDAFRCMQQARHIGKVVVSFDNAHAHVNVVEPEAQSVQLSLPADRAWLVTGGIDGFGLATAHWLVDNGTRHILLVGRRGMDTPGAAAAVEALSAKGAQVHILACDVRDEAAVHALVAEAAELAPPLEGIVHAAAAYDDRLVTNLDLQSIQSVASVKLGGAWNLHRATKHLPLRYFVLYSSVTTAIGNPGQANYVAANAGLEGLAALRHALGLPATCVAWGPIGDAGYLTRNESVKDSLEQRLGRAPMTASQALAQLPDLLISGRPVSTIANFDWKTLARLLPSSGSPRFELLNRERGDHGDADELDIRTLIEGKSPDEAADLVRLLIVEEVARILCIKPERIEPALPLHDLGMDSLMAVELAVGLEQRFGIQLPVMLLNDAPTVDKVTLRIVETLIGDEDTGSNGSDDAQVRAVSDFARLHGEEFDDESLADVADEARRLAEAGARLTV